ncbi:MAG: glycosyltransferase [Bacteroidetes bacterium]|nr:glycosyltransferase [Bacteroidota bacterium]
MSVYFQKFGFGDYNITNKIKPDTFLSVVIPCYNEPDLLRTLQSLFDCSETLFPVEVTVVINSSETDSEEVLQQNNKTQSKAAIWMSNHKKEKIIFHILNAPNLPAKHAGVGLARKIGMDCAAMRFCEIQKTDGVIICLDADCTVANNYLCELENHFIKNKNTTGCSIYFEHPLSGDLSEQHYHAITDYELFLRYYRLSLFNTGFPYHFHTIGSSMAVRNNVYQKQGGMNRRKAGEDFYFLHKVFPLGNFTELNTTCVYPSARESMRVPFGTGSAVTKILKHESNLSEEYKSYNFNIFKDLKKLFDVGHVFYELSAEKILSEVDQLPVSVKTFLLQNNISEKIIELQDNSASSTQFLNRFWRWFDGFMVLKFVHFARDNFYANENIEVCCDNLLYGLSKSTNQIPQKKQLLFLMRDIDRNISL